MKLIKHVLALAFLFCVTANISHAQGTIQYLGTGSPSLFIELGQAAATLPDTMDSTGRHCYFTWGPDGASAYDDRESDSYNNPFRGPVWVAWGTAAGGTCASPVAPFNVYVEMSSDSMAGNRCFFAVDYSGIGGCRFEIDAGIGTTPGNPVTSGGACIPSAPCSLLGPQPTYNDTPIPQALLNTLDTPVHHFFAAATDFRPEDAKFAIARMFTACGAPFTRNPYIQTSYQTYGLGYQGYGGAGNVGEGFPIVGYVGSYGRYPVWDFNISGNDPRTGQSLAAAGRANYTVSTVGAQPIVVVVSPNDGVAGRLASANDIMSSTLSEYFFGGYGRTSDLTGDTVNEHPVTTLIPEPVSGTYSTFEYSVPNSNEFKASQDVNNCTGSGSTATANLNPLDAPSANGLVPGAFRVRAIEAGDIPGHLGSSEVTGALQAATTDTIGYFFWNAANAAGFTSTKGKYLTVNGVDPLKNAYTDGVLPGADAAHPLTDVTFKNLNLGDYAIWSPLRIVSLSPVPAGVTRLIAAAQTVPATAADFIPLSSLRIWKSHYNMLGIGVSNNNNGQTVNPATPGDLCPGSTGEGGGDVGAMTISIHGNSDFCTDFATPIGINDKNQ
jgi:hypothetical protein